MTEHIWLNGLFCAVESNQSDVDIIWSHVIGDVVCQVLLLLHGQPGREAAC